MYKIIGPAHKILVLTARGVRPNEKISVFRVTGLKILGRIGTHIFISIIFFLDFNMHKILFSSSPEKNSRFHLKI